MFDLQSATPTLRALEAAGFTPPKEARTLLAALEAVPDPNALRAEAGDTLRAALLAGDTAAISRAVVAGAALAHSDSVGLVIAPVRDQLIADSLRAVAPDAFTFARQRYDAAGRALMDALAVCDPLAGPDDVPGMTAEAVKAWGSLGTLRADLDAAAKLLLDVLTDVCRRRWRGDPAHKAGLYTLGGDPALVQRVFAWRPPAPKQPVPRLGRDEIAQVAGGRTGAWGALVVVAGAELRCPVESPADFTPQVAAEDATA